MELIILGAIIVALIFMAKKDKDGKKTGGESKMDTVDPSKPKDKIK